MTYQAILSLVFMILIGTSIIIAVCAIRMLLKKEAHKVPAESGHLQNALGDLQNQSGANESTVMIEGFKVLALSLKDLAHEVKKFNDSTGKLGRINLLLVFAIALVTIAYTLAAWLPYLLPK